MTNVSKDDWIILNKWIYGIQAARQYYKKAIEIAECIEGNFNPCLYVKKSAKGAVHVAKPKGKWWGNGGLKKNGLVLKVMEGLQDYFSLKMKFSLDNKRTWLGQPHLIEKVEKKFDEWVKKNAKSQNTRNIKISMVRPMGDNENFLLKTKMCFGLDWRCCYTL